MTFSRSTRTWACTTALVVIAAPAFAQAPDEVAERMTALIEGEGVSSASYDSAAADGGAVVISGFNVRTQEGEGTDTFTAETTRIMSPELGADGGLMADGIMVENGKLVSTNWGEATVERAEGSELAMVPKGVEGATDDADSALASGTLTNITVDPTQSEPFTIASMSFDQGDIVDGIATRRSFEIDDLVLSRGDFGADSDELFDYLGVDEITVDIAGGGNWNVDNSTFEVTEARITGDEIGTFAMSASFGGVTKPTFEQMEANPMQALSPLMLSGMTIDIETGPLVDQAVELRAKTMGVSAEDLRTTALVTSKQMLLALGESPFRANMEAALESFISGKTNSLSLSAAPQSPVPVLAVGLTAQTSPDSLPGLLNLTVSAK